MVLREDADRARIVSRFSDNQQPLDLAFQALYPLGLRLRRGRRAGQEYPLPFIAAVCLPASAYYPSSSSLTPLSKSGWPVAIVREYVHDSAGLAVANRGPKIVKDQTTPFSSKGKTRCGMLSERDAHNGIRLHQR